MTIKQLINQSIASFSSSLYTRSEKKYIIRLLFEDLLKIDKAKLIVKQEEEATEILIDSIKSYLKKLNQNQPFQYILGREQFFGYDFIVNKNVLIPRPETEELVDWVASSIDIQNPVEIVDIGTGSGCIPIVLAKLLPKARIQAIDISEEALTVALQNNKVHATQVNFLQKDILDESQWDFGLKFDVIISNPPYIPNEEKKLMQSNVLDFEPKIALFVADEEALIFYEKITKFAVQYLNKKGLLFFECNEYNAQNVKTIMMTAGFGQVELKKDINGKNRMIKARLI